MNQLPATSPEHYLTGQAALNVPYEDNTFADWHFDEVFLSGRGRFRVAGRDFPDTSNLLGQYGIRECGQVLRRYGVQIGDGEKVYAANHVRAVLDLVVSTLSKGKVPAHVTVSDTLDSVESLKELREQLVVLKTRITDPTTLLLLSQWEIEQETTMEKGTGYDEWFHAKVIQSLDALTGGKTKVSAHDEVMERVWQRVQAKTEPLSA